MNALLGEQRQATGAVREDDSRGRHTTTHRELFDLPTGAFLIDTPGIRALEVAGAEEGVGRAFDDIEELAAACRFSDCRHQGEPGCAVRAAIDEGSLNPERLASHEAVRPARPASVRTARLEPHRLGSLPGEAVVPAVLETSRVAEDAVAPEVTEPDVADDSPGRLQIGVRPWAVVRIDDRAIGETPLAPLELSPGTHTARLEHPDYQPLVRKVTVQSGQTVRLQVDLGLDGIAR